MINKIKQFLYFPGAYYFRFFAKMQLAIWKPKIIVVTGSSGKTTLLHFIESQLQYRARYSHKANSSYGIPFDILGLKRKNLTLDEWPYLFLAAPFRAFRKPPKEKLYVVEADCDRPYEGKFLASLLRPEVTLWTNVSRSHTMNFDKISSRLNPHPKGEGKGDEVEQAIAYEFGFFLEQTKSFAIVNGDNKLIQNQLARTKVSIRYVSQKELVSYKVFKDHTEFEIKGVKYSINALLPKEAYCSIQMTLNLLDYLNVKPDNSFSSFRLPPSRTSIFKGIKNITMIDSSYNATPDSLKAILQMFDLYPSNKKWLVLGDMLELGNEEQEEHEKLAEIINSMKLNKIIMVGPRLSKYTYPKMETPPQPFLIPKGALDYLLTHLRGGEAVLFKGARFLEGVIEHLLVDKNDVKKLCRRELVWQERRKKWGL